MSRRSLIVVLGIPLLVVTLGGLLLLLLRYEPAPYRQAMVPAENRTENARDFLRAFSDFWNASQGSDRDWNARFTDDQVNSFVQTGQADKLLPEGISDLRVIFEADRMRLAFRYRSGLLNTIISISLRIWLPGSESNVLAMKLERIDAGLVPFSAPWVLESISEVARNNGIEVNWYRHEGHPVALIRFQADQARPTLQLLDVQFTQGSITIHGRSRDAQAGGMSDARDVASGSP